MGIEILATAGALAATAGAGYSVYSAEKSRKEAKAEAARQKELAAKQQALIDAENAKQEEIDKERRLRLKNNELLSGSETGITDKTKGSLLV